MSEQQKTKEQLMQMHAEELEQLLIIIGELGFVGYKVSISRMQGLSLQQCVNKHGVSKKLVRCAWGKCVANGYDEVLKKLYEIK